MKRTSELWVFHLSGDERQMLAAILKLYPLVPESYAFQTRSDRPELHAADSQLLSEALAARREENQRQLGALFPDWTSGNPDSSGLELRQPQFESLLQILNDIRLGSWLRLGCPESELRANVAAHPEHLLHAWAMQTAGAFEAALLAALD